MACGRRGLLPHRGLDAAERAEQKRFHDADGGIEAGAGEGWPSCFAIPMALSSRDAAWLALDKLSFRQWLLDNGFTAPTLHWLANYACRDDYGTDYAQTSAWAGLHYFACRNGGGGQCRGRYGAHRPGWQRLAGPRSGAGGGRAYRLRCLGRAPC